jgi:hypothetical protein
VVSITKASVHRLPALRRPRPARQDRHAEVTGDVDGGGDVILVPREKDGLRHDLVEGGVGRIAPTRERIGQHVALDALCQRSRQIGVDFGHSGFRKPF